MAPLVTVILPTTGRSSLERALISVAGQTFEEIELLVVDDSIDQKISTHLGKIIKTGGRKGPSFSRNLGSRSAQGSYVAFLDDDDEWKSNFLTNQISDLENEKLDLVISSASVNSVVRPKRLLRTKENPFQLLYGKPHLLRSDAYLPTSSYVCKVEVCRKIHFDETLRDRENLKFLQEVYEADYQMRQSNKALVVINYDVRNSMSRIDVDEEFLWYEYLRSKNSLWATNFHLESFRNFIRIKKIKAVVVLCSRIGVVQTCRNLLRVLLQMGKFD